MFHMYRPLNTVFLSYAQTYTPLENHDPIGLSQNTIPLLSELREIAVNSTPQEGLGTRLIFN